MTESGLQRRRRHGRSARRGGRVAGDAESTRRLPTRNWDWIAILSWLAAVVASVRATRVWDIGDLIVGLYFAVLSLLFWARAAIGERGRIDKSQIIPYSVVLGVTFGVGAILLALDVASSGAL